jgi:hypothetical protein
VTAQQGRAGLVERLACTSHHLEESSLHLEKIPRGLVKAGKRYPGARDRGELHLKKYGRGRDTGSEMALALTRRNGCVVA